MTKRAQDLVSVVFARRYLVVLFPILIRKPPAIFAGNLPPVKSFSGEAMG